MSPLAIWRWLWNARHKVSKGDRKHCMLMFRSMVYAENEEKFNEKLEEFENDEVIDSYQNFKHHIETLYMGRIEKWTRFKRVSLPTHGNDTTNYVESSFRILKDKTFQRHKSYNLVDTLTVLMEEDSFHFKNKLIDFGNARFNNVPQSSKYKRDNIKITAEQICDLGDGVYKVESETNPGKIYTLSMRTGYCSCKKGQNHSPCKHKFSVSKHFGVSSFSTIPNQDPATRKDYHYIATGEKS